MTTNDIMPGKIVNQEEWLQARLDLLEQEKAHTKEADRLAKARANMPMTKITTSYAFIGSEGRVSLLDLFKGKKQLLLQHVMFDPEWDAACKGCSFSLDNLPQDLQHLHSKDTMYVAVARAPYEKIQKFCVERMGWKIPFYSSYNTSFNYDFNVTMDKNVKAVNYNYNDQDVLEAKGQTWFMEGEQPGMSVFLREGGEIYHTYSSYSRGGDHLLTIFGMLDLTPLGRQDEGHGPEFPYHDTYGKAEETGSCH